MGRGSCHPVVFEAPGRIEPFVLQMQTAVIDADVPSDVIRLLQNRLPLTDRHDLLRRSERQQLPEPPHPTEIERLMPVRPPRLKLA